MLDQLCDVLTDFDYLQARLIPPTAAEPPASLVFDLLRDYLDALELLPREHPRREELSLLHQTIDANSHVLTANGLKEIPALP